MTTENGTIDVTVEEVFVTPEIIGTEDENVSVLTGTDVVPEEAQNLVQAFEEAEPAVYKSGDLVVNNIITHKTSDTIKGVAIGGGLVIGGYLLGKLVAKLVKRAADTQDLRDKEKAEKKKNTGIFGMRKDKEVNTTDDVEHFSDCGVKETKAKRPIGFR